MILVGVTGAIGHGKSTLADMLIAAEPGAKHLESFYVVAEVVDALHQATTLPPKPTIASLNKWLKPLPDILQQTVGYKCTFKQIKLDPEHIAEHPIEYEKLFMYVDTLAHFPELISQRVNQENKPYYRPMLQWIGGYLPKKLDPGIWYHELIRRANKTEDRGAKLCVIGGVRYPMDADIIRDAGGVVIRVYRPGIEQPDLLDPTERERDNIQVDSTVVNNGSLKDLEKTAKALLRDLHTNSLKPQYKS